jgi:hypothetical protein
MQGLLFHHHGQGKDSRPAEAVILLEEEAFSLLYQLRSSDIDLTHLSENQTRAVQVKQTPHLRI